MKSGRDGKLVLVSRDLRRATDATHIAKNLQSALDRWTECVAQLEALAESLEEDRVENFGFSEQDCAAPLPRAYQWIDGSAYVNHVELVRRSRGAGRPESFWVDPLIYQGGSDGLAAPRDAIQFPDESWGIDFEAEIVVITDDVPMGVAKESAPGFIRLYALVNDVSLRGLIPDELAKGFGFFQGKPATTLSPVAVTPDELSAHLVDHTIALPLLACVNGEVFGQARPDVDQVFSFADLIAHAAKTRSLAAGTIVGGGTVSNKHDGGPGLSVKDGGVGYSCIAEQRAVEKLRLGNSHTPFLGNGDRISIEMCDEDGTSIFGRIDQTITITNDSNRG